MFAKLERFNGINTVHVSVYKTDESGEKEEVMYSYMASDAYEAEQKLNELRTILSCFDVPNRMIMKDKSWKQECECALCV